jgi:hypothetical protein
MVKYQSKDFNRGKLPLILDPSTILIAAPPGNNIARPIRTKATKMHKL